MSAQCPQDLLELRTGPRTEWYAADVDQSDFDDEASVADAPIDAAKAPIDAFTGPDSNRKISFADKSYCWTYRGKKYAKKNFYVQKRAEDQVEEIKYQRARAVHYADTGIVLPSKRKDDDEDEAGELEE